MIAGDADALLALYEYSYKDLLSYGVQLTGSLDAAKDAINDVFLNIWERHSRLKPVKNVRAYLFACIRRNIFHTKEQPRQVIMVEDPEVYSSSETSYEEILIAMQQSDETRRKVQAALSKLTDRQKELIELKFYQNKDYREIEEITGMTVKTAYNTIYNAIKVLAVDLRDVITSLIVWAVISDFIS
ncbi:putative RNA polymerase ECF-type sigma factor [Flavihumibacter petaseus NBRC 106054]|uniref:Putative RNA polymerase ECF-type sigma factor n=2 Tax=Flavihumibacter TaxID=1004301 RepID=A0A0E9MZ87_9BACT|nr:putative RNA polymerase ECF-type sigma factor [Flavihumibacter petaseus NBRC 106054]